MNSSVAKVRACRLVVLVIGVLASSCGQRPGQQAPVEYVGKAQTDRYHYDGQLRHVVGAHHYQVFRGNRSVPFGTDEVGWTYNHQPFLAYWNDKFHVQFMSGQLQEHTPPTRVMLVTSENGREWSEPVTVFPVYTLPEIRRGDTFIPAGTKAVMHQRMGFYVAPNDRLLTLGFYSYCETPRHSPNKGQGLGRVVREIYKDGSFGPIYFIRYNRHAGFNEENTNFPFYKTSEDAGFVKACESLLNNKLMSLQWWEEDRADDGFFAIDPSQVQGEDPTAGQEGVTTSAGAGKALCFYHRKDGKVVGLWKNQYSALSSDEGETWSPIVTSDSLLTCGAKVWGQSTEDGRFALVHDQSVTRRNRFPLVAMTGEDGQEFEDMLTVLGEVPPQRYQGIHKNRGPQYVRGIVEGNGNPPGDEMWITYSMNKEDIWVTRVEVPITGSVDEHIAEDFEGKQSVSELVGWNLYQPKWATATLIEASSGNHFLELLDADPYDYVKVQKVFQESSVVTVQFRLFAARLEEGRALEIEVQDRYGARPMRLRLESNWLGLDRAQVFPLEPVPVTPKTWLRVRLKLDCRSQTYDLSLGRKVIRKDVAFAEKVESLERLVFRTGPYRGDVRAIIAENGEPRPAGLYTEDLPGSGRKVRPIRFLIDDVRTSVDSAN